MGARLFLLTARPVAACSPLPIGWWFNETLDVENGEAIHSSLSIKTSPALSARAHIAFANRSPGPLYLMEKAHWGQDVAVSVPIELPEGWVSTRVATQTNTIFVEMKDLIYMAPGLQDLNHFDISESTRPADVVVPAPQRSQIMVAFDNRLTTLPLTVTYALNTDYDPHRFQKGMDACSWAYIAMGLSYICMMALPPFLGLVAFAVVAPLVWRRWRAG